MTNNWERRGVVWPVLLILAGAILLLDNLGRLDLSLWELLFRLWPAILLAIGIELLVPTRSAASYLLTVLLVLAVFAGSYWLLTTTDSRRGATESIEEPLDGDGPVSLILEPVIGTLRLHPGTARQGLLAGSIPAESAGELSVERFSRGGQGVVRLTRDLRPGGWVVFPFSQKAWDLTIDRDVSLELEVDMAAGILDLDLAQLDLRRVDAGIGVGEIRVELPDASAEVRVEGGVGSLHIVLPEGVSARVHISRGLTTLDLPAGYRYEDGIARSPQASGATADLEIHVNLGVGLIEISES